MLKRESATGAGARSQGLARVLVLVLLGALAVPPVSSFAGADETVFEGPVPRAECAPGDRVEPELQGSVPLEDRTSGRSAEGYNCNLEVVGNHAGEGASWQMAWYDDCAYYGTRFNGGQDSPGVQVVDVADPANPELAGNLTTPSMLDPWESLKVTEERGLLASVAAWNGAGPAFFDVYDVSEDCANPELQASLPVDLPIGHEGDWAPDGKTYYGTNLIGGWLNAIDVSVPLAPRPLYSEPMPTFIHGLSISDDGNRLYLADMVGGGRRAAGNGLTILDVSDIQARSPAPVVSVVGSVRWTDGSAAQHTIPVTINGTPYIIFVDEGGYGAARIIDISDETNPRVVSKLKLEIQMPEHRERATAEAAGSGSFAYNAHYCGVDRRDEPTVLGCSYFQSGVRIFDIRDPLAPREIAYFNPGGAENVPAGSQRTAPATSGYPSSQVRFIPERSEVWFTDQTKGFYTARFSDDPATGRPIWPFSDEG